MDEAVGIELMPGDKELESLERPYIRLSGSIFCSHKEF